MGAPGWDLMRRTPPLLAEAYRRGYRLSASCTAWRGDQQLDVPLKVLGGGVNLTRAKGVRATLSIAFAPARGLWDAFAPLGVQLRPAVRVDVGVDSFNVGLGRYEVHRESMSYGDGGALNLDASDLWVRVQRRRLHRALQPVGNAARLAADYAREPLAGHITGEDVTPSPARVWDQVFPDSRDEAVQAMLTAAGMIGYVDADARLVIRPTPRLRGASVWDVDDFRGGVLLGGDRERSNEAVRNSIRVVPAGGARFPQVVVEDTNPASPTFVDGPFGVCQRVWSDPSIRTAEGAFFLGRTVLRDSVVLGAGQNLDVAPHWGLEPWDVISSTLPAQGGDTFAPERHMIDTVTWPLPDGQSEPRQRIGLVSSRPDGGDDVDPAE